MRYALIGLLFAQLVSAADLTGTWASESQMRNGARRQTTFAFIQKGDQFTGYITAGQGSDPIVDGKINGDAISFTVVREGTEGEQRSDYTAKVTPDGLEIQAPTVPGRGGRAGVPPPVITAKRVSTEEPKPLAPKILLTTYKTVKSNGLAKTPPMGWNSWNKFNRTVDDKIVREIADAMVSSGMRDAGYIYVNIDDTWEGERDANGVLQPNEKFPDMKALADYVHSKGLKLGIYSSPGPKTCAGFEGSFGHEELDAKTWAAWGIDYLKYDWCSAGQVYKAVSMQAAYAKMGQALLDSGRPIVYSLCQYGAQNVGSWGAKVGGNLWRTTGDIRDAWASMENLGFVRQEGLEKYSGVGHWNDPDMLEIGNGHMTTIEYQTHMSLWSMLAAPLLAGNDMRDMTPEIRDVLLNKEVIAIDQDKLGKQAVRMAQDSDLEVWARPLAGGAYAVGLFNRGANSAKITARWSDLKINGSWKVRDLWAHADRDTATGEYSAEVPSHGVVLVRLSK